MAASDVETTGTDDLTAEDAAAPHTAVYSVSEPTGDDEPDERVELVRTGLVRAYVFDGHELKRYRLRRPFFGELKNIRLAHERVEDEIADDRVRVEAIARSIITEAKAADDSGISEDETAEVVARLREKSRDAARALIEQADKLRVEWWEKVFEIVSLDGTPEQMPGWVVDPTLPVRLMAHWRAAPFRPLA